MAKLFVLSGSAIGSSFEIDGPALIGRAAGVDVTLPEASVSREHARIAPAEVPGTWRVVDLDSSNGLHFGGRRVTEAIVADGETFILGEIELRLRDEAYRSAPAAAAELKATQPGGGETIASGEGGPLELEFAEDLDEALGRAPQQRKKKGASKGSSAPNTGASRSSDGTNNAPGTPRTRGAAAAQGATGAPGARAGARATTERAARRKAAAGAATSRAAAPGAVSSESGRPVLQYAKTRSGGVDLDQLAGWQKLALALLAIALFAMIAYGAFALVSGARANP